MATMTNIHHLLLNNPIRPGQVPNNGWYDATVVSVEPVVGAQGETRVRFTFLLKTGHLAWTHANLSHDPNSKLYQLWHALGLDTNEIHLARALGRRCQVLVEKNGVNSIVKIQQSHRDIISTLLSEEKRTPEGERLLDEHIASLPEV